MTVAKMYLLKGTNSDGDTYGFTNNTDELPLASFHQGDYVKEVKDEDVSWKWKEFEPILFTGVAIALISGVLIGIPVGSYCF